MKTKKILVVEDERKICEDLQVLFEEEGYSVIAKNTGREGIEAAKKEHPDLIICDIIMKELDGYGVLKALSDDPETKLIPFIFLTAKVEREDIRKGMHLGADDYLFKPYKADELLKAVETRIKRVNMLKASIDKKEKPRLKRYSYIDKVFTKIGSQPHILKINEILYINAENQYSSIHLTEGKSLLIRKSISSWEKMLPEKEFLRIHRSTIINMEYIVKMGRWDNSSLLVYIKNIEEPFVISKRYAAKLRSNRI